MPTSEILAGLPPHGPPPRAFPPEWARVGREGMVVAFTGEDGQRWVANFRLGPSGVWGLHAHPDGRRTLVCAHGQAWVVDADARTAEPLRPLVCDIWRVPGSPDLVLNDQGLALARLGAGGLVWHTRRLSWDGLDHVVVDGTEIRGEAWDVLGDEWRPFAVELATGRSRGGTYPFPDGAKGEQLATAAEPTTSGRWSGSRPTHDQGAP